MAKSGQEKAARPRLLQRRPWVFCGTPRARPGPRGPRRSRLVKTSPLMDVPACVGRGRCSFPKPLGGPAYFEERLLLSFLRVSLAGARGPPLFPAGSHAPSAAASVPRKSASPAGSAGGSVPCLRRCTCSELRAGGPLCSRWARLCRGQLAWASQKVILSNVVSKSRFPSCLKFIYF